MDEDIKGHMKTALFSCADTLRSLHNDEIIDGGLVLLLPRDGDATEVGVAGYAPLRDGGQPIGQIYHEMLAALVWTLLGSGIGAAFIMEATERAIKFFPELSLNNITPLDGLGEMN